MDGFTICTIRQFARENPAFSEPSLRWQVFRAAENGLEAAGAIRRIGRRVYLIAERYRAWLDAQGHAPALALQAVQASAQVPVAGAPRPRKRAAENRRGRQAQTVE